VAALVGWSRVVLGSHFPSDVLAGAVLGCAVVLGLSRVWKLGMKQS
jgi:undecaprenyl-diphosphatase